MPTTTRIVALATAYLRIDDSYALVQSSIDLALQYHPTMPPLLQQALQAMQQANSVLGNQPRTRLQQEHTQQLEVIQQQRVALFASLRRRVRYHTLEGTPGQQKQARRLSMVLQPYARLRYQALPTQTALLTHLLERCRTQPGLHQACKSLGLSGVIASLEQTNQAYHQLYHLRNQTMAARPQPRRLLRAHSMRAYRSFCTILEHACLYVSDGSLPELLERLNALRITYRSLARPHTATHPQAAATPPHVTTTPSPHTSPATAPGPSTYTHTPPPYPYHYPRQTAHPPRYLPMCLPRTYPHAAPAGTAYRWPI